MNKKIKAMLALVTCLVMSGSFVGCSIFGGDNSSSTGPVVNPGSDSSTGGEGGGDVNQNTDVSYEDLTIPTANLKQAEYNTTTSTMPSNWNELTYADNNDTQIMSYIGSSFFDYDYKFKDDKKFNEDGTINKAGIVKGAYTTHYSAATKLEDVTSTVDAKWGYTADQKEEGGYAWKITLRQDLKWDNGDPIKAADFVYSMKQQLDPEFMNMRGNTYYDTLRIKNSRGYFFQNQEGTYESVASLGYASNAEAIAADETLYIDAFSFYNAQGYVDANGNACPQWVAFDDTTVYDTADAWTSGEAVDAFSGKDLWDYFFAPDAPYEYGPYVEVGGAYASWISIYVENKIRDVAWEDVGIYAVDDYSFVICLDKAYALLQDNGSLSYQAAYYMSSLPLVHKATYEACKIAPADGATLWTTNYNTSEETTKSWGPYKLTAFEAGSYYKLEKNPYWYGWNMNLYKNQYNVSAINCRKVTEFSTSWMAFLKGEVDDASLATENIADYKDSKYVDYTPSTGTFGMQLFSDLSVLKESEYNNGILAIDEFRQAFSLGLNRSDVVEKIWPGTATPCLGLVNSEYYYDIENSPNLEDGGVYRNTKEAKEGLLRAYGFVQNADGTWSSGNLQNVEMEDAYDALTGYNLTLAKEKMVVAINELTTNADKYGYDASKDITLIYGASVENAKQKQRVVYLQDVLNSLVEGTALQGKIKVVLDASAGQGWADAFRNGDTQIGFGYGFSGNPFNPFDIIGAFVDPDDSLNYHTYWDTSTVMMTLTMPEGDYEGAGETIEMSLQNWFYCLNGLATEKNAAKKYNWDAGYAPSNVRLTILAALEEQALKKSYSIMLIGDYSGSFLSAKFDYITSDYNTFMGLGGLRYVEVKYTTSEWAEFVAQNNNDLSAEYKKTE